MLKFFDAYLDPESGIFLTLDRDPGSRIVHCGTTVYDLSKSMNSAIGLEKGLEMTLLLVFRGGSF
jgi:hypothetical protein